MNISLKQLRVFSAVYELRNFTSAAEAVHMTQSAVSKVCTELEAEIGVPLFERTTRRVVPCQGAAELYEHAQQMLGTLRAAERSLAGLRGLSRGRVSLASSPMMMYGLLREVIQVFHARHPGIALDLHELSTDDSIDFVRSGRGDFGLVSMRESDPQLAARVVLRERMSLACAATHPLAAGGAIPWPELARHHHITLRSVYSVRRTVDRILQAHGLELRSSIQAGTLTSALGLVGAGLGVTLIPGYAVGFARQLGLAVVEVGADRPEHHEISLVTRRDSRLSLAAAAFVALLESQLATRGSPGTTPH